MLRPLADVSPANWFLDADADWWTKVCLGAPGYDAYARLHLIPDVESPDVDLTLVSAKTLRRILPRHTTTPDACYFAQWVGSGSDPPLPPTGATFSLMYEPTPGVRASARDYHLFIGAVEDLAAWDELDIPHLMWPDDHSWFFAADVDPDWIGVGGSRALIDEILADPDLESALSAYDASDWEVR